MSSHQEFPALPPVRPLADRIRLLVLPGLVAALALGILLSLGTWQLSRLAWKQGLVAQVEERSTAPAIPLSGREGWGRMSPERDEYRRVTVTGRFRHEGEAYLYHVAGDSRQADRGRPQGQGYFVMTPLVTAGGDTVIVNRGFVPTERRDPATRTAGQVEGEMTVTGLVRYPETRGAFAAPDDPARRLFYTRDLVAMARVMGVNARMTAPFSIDAEDSAVPGGLPRGGETRLTFANRHLEYALTWFGLALTLIGVFAAFAIQRLKGQ
jgi:surfeit locus 1 family protein